MAHVSAERNTTIPETSTVLLSEGEHTFRAANHRSDV